MNKTAVARMSLIFFQSNKKNVLRKCEQCFAEWLKATEHLKLDDQCMYIYTYKSVLELVQHIKFLFHQWSNFVCCFSHILCKCL